MDAAHDAPYANLTLFDCYEKLLNVLAREFGKFTTQPSDRLAVFAAL
jgi:hypothetical protein